MKSLGVSCWHLTCDDLKIMGVNGVGTAAVLLKEIISLERTSRDIVTLIEHSP
jgi:hypothetical protein